MRNESTSRIMIGVGTLTMCFGGLGMAQDVSEENAARETAIACTTENQQSTRDTCDERAAQEAYRARQITQADIAHNAGLLLLGGIGVGAGLRRRR